MGDRINRNVNDTVDSPSADYFFSPVELDWYHADAYCNLHCNSELASIIRDLIIYILVI